MKHITRLFTWLLALAISVGVSLGAFLVYQHFTNEAAWEENPRIAGKELYLQVKHKDGLIFAPSAQYSSVTVATMHRVSKRTREYTNIHSIPSRYINYPGAEGLRVVGAPLPSNVLAVDDTLFACVFQGGDGIGCKPIERGGQ